MFEIAIKLDENIYTRLFDNGIEMSEADITAIQMAIREGTVLSESYKAEGEDKSGYFKEKFPLQFPLPDEEIFNLLTALYDNMEDEK